VPQRKEVKELKKEVNPVVMVLIVGVVVIGVVAIGYKMLGPKSYNADKAGSDATMQNFQKTGEFYKPPPGIVQGSTPGNVALPGMGQTAPGGGATAPGGTGGYNLTPPPR
jgi:hypothetical protein